MVDNPADLVQPRGETPADTTRRTTVMEKYRAGHQRRDHISDNSNDTAKISDVGQ